MWTRGESHCRRGSVDGCHGETDDALGTDAPVGHRTECEGSKGSIHVVMSSEDALDARGPLFSLEARWWECPLGSAARSRRSFATIRYISVLIRYQGWSGSRKRVATVSWRNGVEISPRAVCDRLRCVLDSGRRRLAASECGGCILWVVKTGNRIRTVRHGRPCVVQSRQSSSLDETGTGTGNDGIEVL